MILLWTNLNHIAGILIQSIDQITALDFTKTAIKVMASKTLDATIILKVYQVIIIKALIAWIGLGFILGMNVYRV